MAHQCVKCSRIYENASQELLKGCSNCGGKFFFFIRKEDLDEAAKITENLSMEEISRNFKGVEICSVEPGRNGDMFKKFRTGLARVLLGNRGGFTIIGPASVVREIRKDPNKIELLTAGKKKRK